MNCSVTFLDFACLLVFTLVCIRPNKNISVVRVTCQKKLGRVGREIFVFSRFFFTLKNVYQFSQVTIFSPVTHLSAVKLNREQLFLKS